VLDDLFKQAGCGFEERVAEHLLLGQEHLVVVVNVLVILTRNEFACGVVWHFDVVLLSRGVVRDSLVLVNEGEKFREDSESVG